MCKYLNYMVIMTALQLQQGDFDRIHEISGDSIGSKSSASGSFTNMGADVETDLRPRFRN
jgi:hypothetical protein